MDSQVSIILDNAKSGYKKKESLYNYLLSKGAKLLREITIPFFTDNSITKKLIQLTRKCILNLSITLLFNPRTFGNVMFPDTDTFFKRNEKNHNYVPIF